MILFVPPVRNVLHVSKTEAARKELDASIKDMAKAPKELLNITENPSHFFE